jgi:hypothetical protein
VRTTNDVEGWYSHLHNHAGQKYSFNGLNMYLVLDVLYCEAVHVDKNTVKLRQGQKLRRETKAFKMLNRKLKRLWKLHHLSQLTTEDLLTNCAEMYTKYNTKRYTSNADDERECELEQ